MNMFEYYNVYSSSIKTWRAGTELTWFNKVNIMVVDALAPCVAKTSAGMILIM